MKKIFAALVFACLMAHAPHIQAEAHLPDLNANTCADFLQWDSNNTVPILFWIGGYLSAWAGVINMSEEHMKSTINNFMAICAKNRGMTLSEALRQLEKQGL